MRIEEVDQHHVRVTFVWPRPDAQVSMRAQVFDDPNALSHPMQRVGDEWQLSAIVRKDAVFTYQFIVDDPFLDADTTDLNKLAQLMAEARGRSFADPANPHRIFPQAAVIAGATEAPPENWDSVAIMPDAEPMDWFDGPAPNLTTHTCGGRQITVYQPIHEERDVPFCLTMPLVVLLDGECWPRVANLHTAIDTLIKRNELGLATVAFVHNTGGPAERFAEQTCSEDFANHLADEIVPFLQNHYSTEEVIIGGDSLAGLAATHAAFTRPDVFNAVISTSGSHWWGKQVDGEPEWLTRQIAAAPKKPLRFWVDVGDLETGVSDDYAPGVDQRAANRHLRTVLQAKGYDVAYHEAPGGHDFATFRRSTIKGLLHFLGAK
ncbi:DUF3327 domain-containing protein [Lentzea tibetensis]|uniref:DUF3327 domain-containing protein n=1 Tax=Lentzea tibetensis TaxID=2591470 RepID=A0A563EFW7_9PSEU|nr:alpha/beta hydrolase-fold protein [Lentzea tibetensis]TWP44988.1 DUF3327 domain-containing protein [Lentzea tibetensis]